MAPDPREPESIPNRLLAPESPEDYEDRARMIYRLRAYSRMTKPRIAEMFKLSERQVQRVVADYRETRAAVDLDEEVGREVLHEAMVQYDDDLEKATIMYQAAVGDNNVNGALNALSLRARLNEKKVALCQDVGILPRDLGTVRHVLELEEAARRILDVFRRHDVPERVQDAVVAALEGGESVEGTLAA